MSNDKKNIGNIGEQLAAHFLKSNGYSIIARNYWTRFGEIDIVASLKNLVVFVEVKTKTDIKHGEPYEMVGHEKKQRLMRACQLYCSEYNLLDKKIRVDVVSILLDSKTNEARIKHFENAFFE